MARLELDDQGAVAEKVELSSLVLDLAAELWPLAESQQQTLEITENPALSLEGNATELGILIRNLLDNALRYTPAGGRVEVAMGQTPEHRPWLSIRDSGPGIPEALLEAVTQRFQRAADQRISGSGLGLSIAVEIAERQQLNMRLSNRPEGGLEVRLVWQQPVIAPRASDAL